MTACWKQVIIALHGQFNSHQTFTTDWVWLCRSHWDSGVIWLCIMQTVSYSFASSLPEIRSNNKFNSGRDYELPAERLVRNIRWLMTTFKWMHFIPYLVEMSIWYYRLAKHHWPDAQLRKKLHLYIHVMCSCEGLKLINFFWYRNKPIFVYTDIAKSDLEKTSENHHPSSPADIQSCMDHQPNGTKSFK